MLPRETPIFHRHRNISDRIWIVVDRSGSCIRLVNCGRVRGIPIKGAAEGSYRRRFLLKSHATTFAHSASVRSGMPPVVEPVM